MLTPKWLSFTHNPYVVSETDYRSNILFIQSLEFSNYAQIRAKAYPTSGARARVLRIKQYTFLRYDIQMIVLPTNESYLCPFLSHTTSSKYEKEGRHDSWLRMASAAAICCLRFRKLPSVHFQNGDIYIRQFCLFITVCITRE